LKQISDPAKGIQDPFLDAFSILRPFGGLKTASKRLLKAHQRLKIARKRLKKACKRLKSAYQTSKNSLSKTKKSFRSYS
jgi:hypothetical protein